MRERKPRGRAVIGNSEEAERCNTPLPRTWVHGEIVQWVCASGRFDLRGVGAWKESILGARLFLCPAATRWLALDVVRKRLQICQWWSTEVRHAPPFVSALSLQTPNNSSQLQTPYERVSSLAANGSGPPSTLFHEPQCYMWKTEPTSARMA